MCSYSVSVVFEGIWEYMYVYLVSEREKEDKGMRDRERREREREREREPKFELFTIVPNWLLSMRC